MLFWKAKEILEGGGELLKAEAELAGVRLRRALVGSFIAILLTLLAFTGLLALLIGTVILLAPAVGLGASLLLIGSVVILISGSGWAIYTLFNRRATPQLATGSIAEESPPPEAEAAQAKERMAKAVHEQKPDEPDASSSPISDLKDEAIDMAMRNPEIVGSVALLALSVVGPGRSLRLLSRGIATAGLVQSTISALSAQNDTNTRENQTAPQDRMPPRSDGHPKHASNGVAT
ncbi:MAG: phage holin family protein [Phycisphaerales bacterium JB052]